MKPTKAFFLGAVTLVPLVLGGWIFYTVVKINSAIWKFILERIPSVPIDCYWLISLAFSIIIITLIGYAVTLLHPATKILRRFPLLRGIFGNTRGAIDETDQDNYPVVWATWGGAEFLALLTEVLHEEGSAKYKVVVLSAPLPITGQIMKVPKEKIRFTGLTRKDMITQLTTFGFQKLQGSAHQRDN